jgi:hypothetical protein
LTDAHGLTRPWRPPRRPPTALKEGVEATGGLQGWEEWLNFH